MLRSEGFTGTMLLKLVEGDKNGGTQFHEISTFGGIPRSPLCNMGEGPKVLMRPKGIREGNSPGVF